MRSSYALITATAMLLASGCGDKGAKTGETKGLPKPGTIVATDQMSATDQLNKFNFSIKVVADSDVRSGVYDVDVDFGPNFAEGKFTMPKGGEELKPVLRRSATPNTYIIGFNVAGDTAFYDYFEISSDKGATKMRYIKSYSF